MDDIASKVCINYVPLKKNLGQNYKRGIKTYNAK